MDTPILNFSERNLKSFLIEIENLNKDKLFISGLIIKIILIIFSKPLIHDLFIPFIQNSILNPSIDPWSNYISEGGDINSFPYGLIMLIGYFPLSALGNFIDLNIIDLNLFEFGFKFSSLIFDYLLLIVLFALLKYESKKLLIFCYWLSPVVIYITYLHGQLDILPLTLLMASILAITFKSFKLSGFLIALAISSKLSMMIALPFILIYINNLNGIKREIKDFIFSFFLFSFLFIGIYLLSNGYFLMVFQSREFSRLYSVFILYGQDLKLYVVPIIYLLSLYLIWRLKRINQDLFIIGTGLGFFSILIFLPPAPGWSIWLIPFLVYYQIKSKRDLFSISIIYNLLVVLNIIANSQFISLSFLSDFIFFEFDSKNNSNIFFLSSLFTAQQGFSFLLAIRIYIYGLTRNNFYSLNNKPLLISIKGNADNFIKLLKKELEYLINPRNLIFIKISDFISKGEYIAPDGERNILKRDNEIFRYYDDYLSRGLNSLNKFIDKNKKDYLFIHNDLDYENIFFNRKVDFFINVNVRDVSNQKEFFENQFGDRFDLNFDYRVINDDLDKPNYAMTIYLPLGVLHSELLKLLITISSLHVDSDVSKDKNWVKMRIEGNPSSDDIALIARNLIKEIDDYPIDINSFSHGYQGIMQILLLARISYLLKMK